MDFTDYSISTERLIIRSFTQMDANDMFVIKTGENFTKYILDEPWTCIQDAKEFIDFALWLYKDDINRNWFRLFFAICNKQTNELIGYCGFGNTEYMPASVEIFYGIKNKHQNNGYAYEACMKLIKIANDLLNIKEFIGFVHCQNQPSLKVLEKMGFNYIKRINDTPSEHNQYNGQLFYAKLFNEN